MSNLTYSKRIEKTSLNFRKKFIILARQGFRCADRTCRIPFYEKLMPEFDYKHGKAHDNKWYNMEALCCDCHGKKNDGEDNMKKKIRQKILATRIPKIKLLKTDDL